MLGMGFLQYCIPGVLAFQANNITRHSKRAVATATCMMGGGVGGIIAGVAFKSNESPGYRVSSSFPVLIPMLHALPVEILLLTI